jgi:hypothetical protein
MSIECGECERDLRGGHAEGCSRKARSEAIGAIFELLEPLNYNERRWVLQRLTAQYPIVPSATPTYRERLLAIWQETDARSGKYVAECSGAMKDLLLELGMEWDAKSGEYIFP